MIVTATLFVFALLADRSDWMFELRRINWEGTVVAASPTGSAEITISNRNATVIGPAEQWKFAVGQARIDHVGVSDSGRTVALGTEDTGTGRISLRFLRKDEIPWQIPDEQLGLLFPSAPAHALSSRQMVQQESGYRAFLGFLPNSETLAVWSSVSNGWRGVDYSRRLIRQLSPTEEDFARELGCRSAWRALLIDDVSEGRINGPRSLLASRDTYRMFRPAATLFLATNIKMEEISRLYALLPLASNEFVPDVEDERRAVNESNFRRSLLAIAYARSSPDPVHTRFDLEGYPGAAMLIEMRAKRLSSNGCDFRLVLDREPDASIQDRLRFIFSSSQFDEELPKGGGRANSTWEIEIRDLPAGRFSGTLFLYRRDDPAVCFSADIAPLLRRGERERISLESFSEKRTY